MGPEKRKSTLSSGGQPAVTEEAATTDDETANKGTAASETPPLSSHESAKQFEKGLSFNKMLVHS